jgi:DNA topoisomerase-1
LRHVTDTSPGIRRQRSGTGFCYVSDGGKPVRAVSVVQRIRALAVPPAWRDVWICADPAGHLQATGRDARGRKQYRYHRKWREARDEYNFDRMLTFGRALPEIRRRVRRDLRRRGLGREKVLASVVRLLELTAARVGNRRYAAENHSFGLTTLRDHHASVSQRQLRLHYRGKGGRKHVTVVEQPRLRGIVKRCRDLPGMHLFQYVDETGGTRAVTSADVNRYLAEVSGGQFSAKDFRTWTGTVVAARTLGGSPPPGTVRSQAETKRHILDSLKQVAQRLGNTPAICRKCYVHPAILEAFAEGTLIGAMRGRGDSPSRWAGGLRAEERALIRFLRLRGQTA